MVEPGCGTFPVTRRCSVPTAAANVSPTLPLPRCSATPASASQTSSGEADTSTACSSMCGSSLKPGLRKPGLERQGERLLEQLPHAAQELGAVGTVEHPVVAGEVEPDEMRG